MGIIVSVLFPLPTSLEMIQTFKDRSIAFECLPEP